MGMFSSSREQEEEHNERLMGKMKLKRLEAQEGFLIIYAQVFCFYSYSHHSKKKHILHLYNSFILCELKYKLNHFCFWVV